MIHVFNGCKELCALPGRACTACGDCCKQVDCKPIEECCKSAGQGCSQFTEKPLSSFVVIAFVMSILEAYCCISALNDPTESMCIFPSGTGSQIGVQNWLYVQMGFSVLNLAFAPWFQRQVWNQILTDLQQQGGAVMTGPSQTVSASVVQNAFKSVFLQDIGVLFYFFCLLASFAWSYQGKTWITEGSAQCDPNGSMGWSYGMGLGYFWVAFWYSIFWYYCSCCAGSVQLKEPIASYGPGPDS